jgi:hypothetical protein
MNAEEVAYLIASILAAIAWVGNLRFIYLYATRSPWRETLIGRTMMQGRLSMFALLTFALTNRWLQPAPVLYLTLGLAVYAGIAYMEWQQSQVVWYAQKGKITIENPNYTPIRDWIRRRRGRSGKS